MPAPLLRSNVLAAKDRLAQEGAKLKQQHDASSPGIQVCRRLTDMLDHVVLDLYQSALEDLPDSEKSILSSEVALVAHGGYGRRDVGHIPTSISCCSVHPKQHVMSPLSLNDCSTIYMTPG